MGKVDLKALKNRRDELKSGGDFLEYAMGNTLVYVCPPPREADLLPFIETKVHQKFNPGMTQKAFCICLDPDKNPWLLSEHIEEFLTRTNKETGEKYAIDVTEGCPVCEALSEGRLGEQKEREAKDRWLYALAQIAVLPLGADFGNWTPVPFSVRPYLGSVQVSGGIWEVFMSEGDITDFDAAIFCNVSKVRNPKKKMIEYEVKVDRDSQKKPVKISPEQRKIIAAAMKVGGPADLYRVAGVMIKSRSVIEDMMTGSVELDGGDGGGSAVEDKTASLRERLAQQRASRQQKAAEPTEPEASPDDDVVEPVSPKTTAKVEKPGTKEKPLTLKEKALKVLGPNPTSEEKKYMVTCFSTACDVDDETCQKCRVKVLCAEGCNLAEPPPDFQEPEEEAAAPDGDGDSILATDCEPDVKYELPDGRVGSFTGNMKNKPYFDVDGEPVWLAAGSKVKPVPNEPEEPVVDEVAERLKAKREALKAKAKK